MIDRTFDVRLEITARDGSVTEHATLLQAPDHRQAMVAAVQFAIEEGHPRVRALWAVIHPSDRQQRPTRARADD